MWLSSFWAPFRQSYTFQKHLSFSNPVSSGLGNLYKQYLGPYIDAIWKLIHTSPNLRRVTWSTVEIDKVPKHAPFHELTCIDTFVEFSIDDALAFLAAAPLIEDHLRLLIINSRSTLAWFVLRALPFRGSTSIIIV